FGAYHPETFCLHRHRKYILPLSGASIEPRQLAANDDVRVERIGNDLTIFFCCDGLPIAKRDLAFITAALNSHGTAFLLSAVKPVRKPVIRAHMIPLRRRLVIPRAPGLAAVDSDDCALVRSEQNDAGIARIDPNVLIIVA